MILKLIYNKGEVVVVGQVHFNMDEGEDRASQRKIKGIYMPVAVLAYYTATGRVYPLHVKYEDEKGCIQTIKQLNVLKCEEKNYAGIRSIRYDCESIIDGIPFIFILLHQPDFFNWKMII